MKHFTLILAPFLSALTSLSAQTRATVAPEDYPFVLTTDPQNPVLYFIYSGRDGGATLESCQYVFINEIPWKGTEYMVQIMRKNPNQTDISELWYFMEEEGMIKIISAADGRMITVPDTQDGAKKAYTQTEAERTHANYTWKLDKTNGFYAFQTSDGKTFLSHNGNWASAGAVMGLYNANGSKDQGSRVFFKQHTDHTAIAELKAKRAEVSGIYTITGRRIDKITAPGIYIVNGKKNIVR